MRSCMTSFPVYNVNTGFRLAPTSKSHFVRYSLEVDIPDGAIFARTKATGLPLLWELEQERMRAQLLFLLQWEYERDRMFIPAGFEVPFGREETSLTVPFFPAEPVSFVENEVAPVFLHGRIDRIDVTADGRQGRILDYKVGKRIRGRFAGGTALQLPLYSFRRPPPPAGRAMGGSGSNVTFRPAAGRKDHTAPFSPDTWAEELEGLKTLVGAITHGIRTGVFPHTRIRVARVRCHLWRIGGSTCGAKTGRRAARFSAPCEKHTMSDNARADAEARRRAASEFATTFLVEAGAGTGKTTVLLASWPWCAAVGAAWTDSRRLPSVKSLPPSSAYVSVLNLKLPS